MEVKRENQTRPWVVALVGYALVAVLFSWMFSNSINTDFARHIDQQRQNSVSRMVQLAYNTVHPLVEQVRTGELSRDEARSKIGSLVREMTYEDEFGPNYIFMSTYDGVMLVQPYEPEKEGTNQWLLQDGDGHYIIQILVRAAKETPQGSFVTYGYYLPGHSAIEEKLSFVMGIPEIDAYIGTGMYVESTYEKLEAILQKQSTGYIAMTILILTSLLLYMRVLLRSNRRLEVEIQERTYVENNLRTVFNTIHDAIIIHDEKGRLLYANNQASALYGMPREDLVKTDIIGLSGDPVISYQWGDNVREQIKNQGFAVFEWKALRPLEQTTLEIEVAVRQTQWSGQSAYVAAVRDITERKEYMERVRHLAFYDSLTGLPNRVHIMGELQKRLARGGVGAVFFVDVDNFKVVNDTYGHTYGDKMLVEIARRLSTLASPRLFLSRLGGDEFLILSAGTTDETEARALAEQLTALFKKGFHIDNTNFSITSSMGIAFYPRDGATEEELLQHADLAMYKAKSQGRDRYVLYDDSLASDLAQRTELEKRLREAYKNKEFLLYYQPQVDARASRVVGLEALIRWNSATLGMVSPGAFIHVAEEIGLINEIGQWVIEQTFAFAKSLTDKELCVSCNVSPVQLRQNNFVRDVIEIFDRLELKKGSVALEITETGLVESFSETYAKLTELRDHGIMIYLDDFGTGYSSLNYMKSLPIDVLKIDKSFIDNITEDSVDGHIVKTIVTLARKIGLRVIAEGVEMPEQQAYLSACGCNFIQGYLFSRPVPEEELLALI